MQEAGTPTGQYRPMQICLNQFSMHGRRARDLACDISGCRRQRWGWEIQQLGHIPHPEMMKRDE